ncbi:2-phosphosulfolactate phosphatase [Cetobacterium somerae]|uniref:2-phosphosulfolactate phosphatase n=1 Tax=Cetobacterium somerae TaxID=188913 RepID=UPI0038916A17
MEGKKDGFLAGERRGLKIEGFKFGNSPLEFTKEAVQGKEIFMTTSNGTRAIENALSADNLYIACYLNISAISEKLLESEKDVVILCAGTDDEFSLDDSLCAGMIIKKMSEKIKLEINDLGLSLKKIADLTSDIKEILSESKHYSYLKSIGYENDLEYCTTVDAFSITPFYKNGKIKLPLK